MEVLVKGISKSYISRNLINGFLPASILHVQDAGRAISNRKSPKSSPPFTPKLKLMYTEKQSYLSSFLATLCERKTSGVNKFL